MAETSPLTVEFEHAGHRVTMVLPSESDHISAQIVASQSFYEPAFLLALKALLKPGDLVLDVGANIGNHSVYFAKIAGCRVMAFEPVASTCEFLRQNVHRNGLDGLIQVSTIALGEHEGTASVSVFDADNLGATRLKLDLGGEIKISTVDDLKKTGPVRLIKIDVEGMDASVVAGARETLARDRPIVACEAATQDEYQRLYSLLEAQDYVSVACFNATDTFIFMPASSEEERRLLIRHGFGEIIELQRGARAIDGRFAQMGRYAERVARDSQGRAVARTEELIAQSADLLRADLAEHKGAALQDLRHALEGRIEAVSAELDARTKRIGEMEQGAEKLERESTGALRNLRSGLNERVGELYAELELRITQVKERQQEMQDAIGSKIEQTQLAHQESQESMRQALLAELQQQQATLHQFGEKVESKHASGTQQIDQISVQLKELAVGLMDARGGLASAITAKDQTSALIFQQLCSAQAQLESTRAVLDERQRQLAAENDHVETMRQAQRKAETEMAGLRTRLGSEVMEKHRWQQVAATASTRARSAMQQVEIHGRSITFQIGSAVQASLRSITGMVKLPVRMFRIAREMARRRASPGEAPTDWRVVVPVQMPAPIAQVDLPSLQPVQQTMANQTGTPDASSQKSDGTVQRLRYSPRLPSLPRRVENLKLAVIMDEFTFSSYAPSCNVEQLLPSSWRQQLEAFAPHMLFIESAWQGKESAWQGKVVHSSPELDGIIAWCQERRIPTVFWNKEDPVHFETFVGFAQRFDYVFTTDIDCIGRYKAALGHDRIFLLPFACQPISHNPIEKYQRKDAFCFAGAYYTRYPERQRDFDVFIDSLSVLAPVEIYDRNHGKDHPDYMFPERYRGLILGNLTFDQIDLAYKGYRYAINLNSVKQSQTMFARRAFDLLGCNTLTVSNYSRGLRLMFGDLVVTTDSGAELLRRLQDLLGASNVPRYRKFRLAGLRKVLQEHTYADRLAYILTKISGFASEKRLPRVQVVAYVRNDTETRRVVEAFYRQSYRHKKLVLVAVDRYVPHVALDRSEISLFGEIQADAFLPATAWSGDFVACFSVKDYYGPNYLNDLALATLYSDAPVIGKAAYYGLAESGMTLIGDERQYKACRGLAMRRSIASAALLAGSLAEWAVPGDHGSLETASAFAIDEFNYVADASHDSWPDADDLTDLDIGLPLAELLQRAEAIEPQTYDPLEGTPTLTGEDLASVFAAPRRDGDVRLEVDGAGLVVMSSLPHDKHHYVYAKQLLPTLSWEMEKHVSFHLDMEPGVSVELAMLFLDGTGAKIGSVVKHACRNVMASVPDGATQIRLALRVKGTGEARINRLVFGHLPSHSSLQLGRADHLLITNQYPSGEHLYRNAFVHRRVKGYRERGLRTDVFCLRDVGVTEYHEFEDVDVTVGWKEQLQTKIRGNHYRSVLVHFLDRAMWDVLKGVIDDVRILVWVHGSDIQHWQRREFNFDTDAERARARIQSDERMAFWREVLEHPHPNLHVIFVSRYLAETAMADLGVQLPPEQYSIVHNFIDGELFDYQPKDPAQRWKILSIRPFASRVYANDLSVRTILALRDEPEFERMEFRLIGDGPLFDTTLAPVLDLPNVRVERGFLPQAEIARLHKEYGVFLVPTRMDSQGVSRDEAMASGLVPLTNAVAAVPEFVDDQCGLLAPGEDVEAMAAQLLGLVRSPEKFQRLSAAAATRTRQQCGSDQTLSREAELIRQSPFVSMTPLSQASPSIPSTH